MDKIAMFFNSSVVFQAGGLVLGILILSSLLIAVLAKTRFASHTLELKLRVKSWWVMAFFFLYCNFGKS